MAGVIRPELVRPATGAGGMMMRGPEAAAAAAAAAGGNAAVATAMYKINATAAGQKQGESFKLFYIFENLLVRVRGTIKVLLHP